MLFAADAEAKSTQGLFLVKLLFVATGVVTIVLIRRHVYGANADSVVVSGTAKGLAILSLVVWVAAITAGRLLAYVQEGESSKVRPRACPAVVCPAQRPLLVVVLVVALVGAAGFLIDGGAEPPHRDNRV